MAIPSHLITDQHRAAWLAIGCEPRSCERSCDDAEEEIVSAVRVAQTWVDGSPLPGGALPRVVLRLIRRTESLRKAREEKEALLQSSQELTQQNKQLIDETEQLQVTIAGLNRTLGDTQESARRAWDSYHQKGEHYNSLFRSNKALQVEKEELQAVIAKHSRLIDKAEKEKAKRKALALKARQAKVALLIKEWLATDTPRPDWLATLIRKLVNVQGNYSVTVERGKTADPVVVSVAGHHTNGSGGIVYRPGAYGYRTIYHSGTYSVTVTRGWVRANAKKLAALVK